jgi:lysophospholipase L1-like esterase
VLTRGRQGVRAFVAVVLTLGLGGGVAATATDTSGPTAVAWSTRSAGAEASAAAPRHTLVGLGDSVASGSHCDCVPFVERYGRLTMRGTRAAVRTHNLGVPGLTTVGLLRQLSTGTSAARAVSRADIITITIGANDMIPARRAYERKTCTSCFITAATAVRQRMDALLTRVAALRSGRPTEVLVTTYWNVFEEPVEGDGHPAGYRQMAERATRRTNQALCDAAGAAHAACIDLYRPFKGRGRDPAPLLADDGDHPNSAGHALIAETLARHGWRELAART